MKKISSFRGEHEFLSNFYPCSFELHLPGRAGAHWYLSAEHAYQSAKAVSETDAEYVRLAASAGSAKARGRRVKMRPDWDEVRLTVMASILRAKFALPDLRERLLATGDAELVEGNSWKDRYWGVYAGIGENHLGKLLTAERERIRMEVAA